MLIYQIFNKVNGKSYIGQTIKDDFNKRYHGGKWYNNCNSVLLEDYKKYGIESFDVFIIIDNVKSISSLNHLENYYSSKFNSFYPDGYNLVECGFNKLKSELVKKNISLGKRKNLTKIPFTFKCIKSQKIISGEDLSLFCKQNGFRLSHFKSLLYGNFLQYCGYCLPKTSLSSIENKYVKHDRKITLFNKFTDTYKTIHNIEKFCREFNLNPSTMREVINKKYGRKSCGGWILISDII